MLTQQDRRIIDFERWCFRLPEPKDQIVADVLGISSADYYRRLCELIPNVEAQAYDPLTMRRLRRVVEGR